MRWRWGAPQRFVSVADTSNALPSFFFQAEYGIRDVALTGVQTCALPIFPLFGNPFIRPSMDAIRIWYFVVTDAVAEARQGDFTMLRNIAKTGGRLMGLAAMVGGGVIGRALCRERVYMSGFVVS